VFLLEEKISDSTPLEALVQDRLSSVDRDHRGRFRAGIPSRPQFEIDVAP
jgi:hypothetical protein